MTSINAFANHLPIKIRFGEGVIEELESVLDAERVRCSFVVFDEGIDTLIPPIDRALRAAEQHGVRIVRCPRAPGEPVLPAVEDAVIALKESDADAIVAIGGGSVIDTAKVARTCAQLHCTARELFTRRPAVPEATTPLICVPTTAGTGSEVSGGAIITDPETDEKMAIASPHMRAAYALVDPELTWSLPATVTMHTGIDALAQAIAALVAKTRTPIGDAIGLEGTRLAGRSLVRAVTKPDDRAARADMACASLLGGLAMNISDAAAEHSLGQALGGAMHLPHGLTIGLVLAETLDRERVHAAGQLERVADALGVPDDGSHDGSRAVRGVREILFELDFPVMRDVGVTPDHIEDLANRALADFFISQSPSPWTREEVEHAFRTALALERRTNEPERIAG